MVNIKDVQEEDKHTKKEDVKNENTEEKKE